jgi:hypothetical protein
LLVDICHWQIKATKVAWILITILLAACGGEAIMITTNNIKKSLDIQLA